MTTGQPCKQDRSSYFFIDVQARGEYPNYAKKQWERDGIEIEMTEEDLALLKEHTVDFIFFLLLCKSCGFR